jgi:carboxymethylenebutenolidase
MLSRRTFVAAGACMLVLTGAGCATVAPAGDAVTERSVEVAAADGTADALLFYPSARGGRWPAVIVWTDTGGLRPAYVEIGRKLAAEGYVVLMPNAYYRSVKLDGSVLAPALPTERARERATQWRAAASDEAVMRDTRAYMAFLDAQPQTATDAKAGVLGFDYGTAAAFFAARALPERIAAVVAFYPAGTATPRPNSPHLFVNQSKAAYYVAMARNDDEREPGDKDDFRKAFADAGLEARVDASPAAHGFSLSDDPAYDPAASEAVWARTFDLFRAKLVR